MISLAFTALGCGPSDTFPCGEATCRLANEVCLIDGDKCPVCVPRPAACDAEVTCGCLPPATDPSWGVHQCDDEGTCTEQEGGLVVSCTAPHWGCG